MDCILHYCIKLRLAEVISKKDTINMSQVKKAVIPVAGLGTRMLPATKAIPKEMLPVVDKPLIQYVVSECVAAGLKEIILVTHASKNSIENHFDTSFELEATMNEVVKTGQWVGDCFLFTNDGGKLNYYVGGEVVTLAHLDHPMYLMGFVPREDRVFMIDKM